MAFARAARVSDIPAGTIRQVLVADKSVALANVQGRFYAISDVCLHQGGPLGEGELADTVVTCPWHGWQFDVTNGKVVQNPSFGVACYQAEVRGDEVFVDLA
jgi:nitrite reductase/ring-hydroxylating ferredoxin subunit